MELGIEILIELGLHKARRSEDRMPSAVLSAFLYAILGIVVGAASLWIWPYHLAPSQGLAIANLFLAPFACGFAMAEMGRWRTRRGQEPLRLDRFSYGFLFALCMGMVRYFLAS